MLGESTAADKKSSCFQRLYPLGFRQDAVTLIKMSIPLAISYILSTSAIMAVSLAFMGHLGRMELNASSLGNAIYLLICYSLMLGLNFGCDTLLPEYFGGDKRKMGIILQRGVIIAIYACFISWILMLDAKPFLEWLMRDAQVVVLTDIYLRYLLPMVPLTALSLSLRIYIATTERMIPILVVNIIGNLINILSHYICIYQLHMGIRAAPISIVLANVSIVLGYILYIRFSSLYAETWHPVTLACLQEWNIYLKYAIPGVIIIMVEYWSIETSVIFAAHLNHRSLSAQAVVQQTVFVVYLIVEAFGDVGNILIGQKFGKNRPKEAINTKNVIYTVITFVIVFNFILILICHRWLPYLFNVEESAVQLTQHVLLLAGVVNVFDGYHVTQTGIAKACGLQKYTAVIWMIGFGIIGLPLAYILTFIVRTDIYGFWIGMIAAETTTNIILFVVLWRFDWYSYAKEVTKRICINTPSKLSGDELPLNASTSNPNFNDNKQLLSDKYNVETNVKLDESDTTQLQLDEQIYKSAETTSDESLFELLSIKLGVLLVFICLFVMNIVILYK